MAVGGSVGTAVRAHNAKLVATVVSEPKMPDPVLEGETARRWNPHWPGGLAPAG